MKKIQGERNAFIEFLKNKAQIESIKPGQEVLRGRILSMNEEKEIKNLALVLKEKIKDVKLINFDVEEELVSKNQKDINKIKHEFFKDLSKKSEKFENDIKLFGQTISVKFLATSLAVTCAFVLIFSMFANGVKSKEINGAVSHANNSIKNSSVASRSVSSEEMQDFILKNSLAKNGKGVVAGAEEEASSNTSSQKSDFMKTLSSLALKQIQLSNLMNNKLLDLFRKD